MTVALLRRVKSYKFRDTAVLFPNDDVAIVTYRVTQKTAKRGERDGAMQEMNDSSAWVRQRGAWKCASHTETPAMSGNAGA